MDFLPHCPVSLSNTCQTDLTGADGATYRLQVSWPQSWQDRKPPTAARVPILYLVDGNAMFLTATEAMWRRAHAPHSSGGGRYPLTDAVYNIRQRAFDLTPSDAHGGDGFGGADVFLDFIAGTVRPFVKSTLFPSVEIDREGIFGHLYGGLFVLHALFTHPQLFSGFMAASPSIYWSNAFILKEEEQYREVGAAQEQKPTLMMYFGSYEKNPQLWPGESPENFKKRQAAAQDRSMSGYARSMYERLSQSNKLHAIALQEYPQEDHGSVVGCVLSRSLTTFFEEWPFLGA